MQEGCHQPPFLALPANRGHCIAIEPKGDSGRKRGFGWGCPCWRVRADDDLIIGRCMVTYAWMPAGRDSGADSTFARSGEMRPSIQGFEATSG
jgi:hypothetical protein